MAIEKHCKYFKEGECKGRNKVDCPFQDISDVVNCTDPKEQYITRLKADIMAVFDDMRAEVEIEKLEDSPNFCVKAHNIAIDRVLAIFDKYKAEMEAEK